MSNYKFQKPDKNQSQIVEDLRKLDFQVDDVHGARGLGYDIVVTGIDYGKRVCTLRVEIKSEGGELTRAEKKYHEQSKHHETLIIAHETKDILDWFDGWRVTK